MRDIEHTIDVPAETLYEAIAAALAALQQDSWVDEIAQGLNTVSVLVQQPPVKHEVKMKDFLSWIGRPGGSPAEVALRERVRKLLVKTNASAITKSRKRHSPIWSLGRLTSMFELMSRPCRIVLCRNRSRWSGVIRSLQQ